MNPKERAPTDFRAMRKRHERWTLLAAIVVLVVVGAGLIGLLFGLNQMLSALPCLMGGAAVIAALYFFFVIAERWAQS